jgi:hypothetical protein
MLLILTPHAVPRPVLAKVFQNSIDLSRTSPVKPTVPFLTDKSEQGIKPGSENPLVPPATSP